MTQALQEKDIARLLAGTEPMLGGPAGGGAPARGPRQVRRRWRLRPRAAILQRFVLASLGWTLAGLLAAGALGLPGGAVAGLLAWLLAAGAALWVFAASERPWWVRLPAAVLLPGLAAGWVVGVAQNLVPLGTGASAGLIAVGLGALGVRLAGFQWDYRTLAFFPALALLALPLEAGWASPGAGQYTLAASLILWGSLAMTIPLEQTAGGWKPRVLSLDLAVGADGPATVGIIGTLGNLHASDDYVHYSLEALAGKVQAFQPDVLCLAITPDDWLAYRQDPNGSSLSPEYRDCLLPLAEAAAIAVAPVDPASEDLRLLERAADADPRLVGRDLEERQRMLALWSRAELGLLCCNDAEAQAAAKACHAARLAFAPDLEQVLWQRRNEDLTAGILNVLRENPGRRVLVVVGAEHIYWVRETLGQAEGLDLLPFA